MRIRITRVRSIAALMIAALLSMQWAAAAHACDALTRSAPSGRQAHSDCRAGASHHSPMKSARSLSCAAHCSLDQQGSGVVHFDLPAFTSSRLNAWHAIEASNQKRSDRAMSLAVDTGPPPGTPPIYLSQRSLLI